MPTTHSLLTLLEKKSFTKQFFEQSQKICYNIIVSNKYNFTEPLSFDSIHGLLSDINPEYLSILDETQKEDLFDDDVFGFACQKYLVELAEDADVNQDKMFHVKKFLTYHMIYKEAMKDSPYDKVLQMLDGKNPDGTTNEATQLNVNGEPAIAVQKPKTILDNIDPKYINCKFTFKNSKSYQKPQLYKGCKFLKVDDDLSHQYYVDSWDTTTITDDQGIYHQIKESYPIFATNKPSVGDIAFVLGSWVVIANKDILELLNSQGAAITYYTTKFNNRKVEVVKVKRFACGTTEKDISQIPYHVEIVYEDIKVNHDLDAISKHYNVSHDKLIAKEVDLIKEMEIALDHPLNVARSEWCMLVADSGAGKTTAAVEYANNKGIPYIVQQGHAQLTVDDLLGYKSITDGTYFPSLLRDAVQNGKIFIIDEIDACNPNVLLALNSLKNKKFQFADALIDIHPNFRLIATANTLEYSDVFNGRSKLDQATLSRFKIINCDLEAFHLAIRYGLENIKDIRNIDRLNPRDIERLVTESIIAKELSNDN